MGELRSAWEESGELFVIMVGAQLMPQLHAGNLALMLHVSDQDGYNNAV